MHKNNIYNITRHKNRKSKTSTSPQKRIHENLVPNRRNPILRIQTNKRLRMTNQSPHYPSRARAWSSQRWVIQTPRLPVKRLPSCLHRRRHPVRTIQEQPNGRYHAPHRHPQPTPRNQDLY
jgi:hypothetical protein